MTDKTGDLPIPLAFDRLQALIGADQAPAFIERLRNGSASESEWLEAGELLLHNDLPAAATLLELACRQSVDSVALHYQLGNALRMSARASEAEVALRKTISLDPSHANASISLAHLLREQGRMTALAEVMLASWLNLPRSLENDQRVLAFLCECGRFVEADSLVPAMLAAHPQDTFLLRRSGEIALTLGRFDEARRQLRATLERDAGQASAWLRLAHTHRFTDADDADLRFLEAAASKKDLNADVLASVGFGLGKALDDLGRFDEAAAILKRANAGWRNTHPWDTDGWQRFVEMQTHSAITEHAAVKARITPVFIIGMPRSGTTLVESLLTRDAQIRGRGELNWIPVLARQLGPNPTASTLGSAAEFLLSQLRQDDEPAHFFIDKNPLNFRYLGLISAMLPNAKIIHCRRQRRDTALSLWSQHFAHEDLAWSYDFADISNYMRGHDTLMAYWERALPASVFSLDYEALVADPEAMIARVRTFLGLEETAAQTDQERTSSIATASVWQARQKVHGQSVGRWRHYQATLPELLDIPEN